MGNTPCPLCGKPAVPGHSCPGTIEKMLGRLLDGRYRIEGVLGQGGMGTVYRALQVSVQRPVAVKTLHPSLAVSPLFFERFRREAEHASKLRHPNVITVFDFGRTEDGLCYYVMEMVDGQSLRQMVKKDGPLSLRRAVNIIEQAARGLAHAHASGVVHRDLKPHNLMVQELEGREYVKVLDFGLVKALVTPDGEQNLTSTGQILGTPQYMPPEQASGEDVDPRSDLYSLAAVFYYSLTGASPYGANTVRKALNAALAQPVPSIASRRIGSTIPRTVDEFLRKALHKDRALRHQNAEQFIEDLLDSIADASDAQLDALPSPSVPPSEPNAAVPAAGSPRAHSVEIRATLPRSRAESVRVETSRRLNQKTGIPARVGARASSAPPLTHDTQVRVTAPDHSAQGAGDAETGFVRAHWSRLLLVVAPVVLMVGVVGAVLLTRKHPEAPLTAGIEVIPGPAAAVSGVSVSFRTTPRGAGIFDGKQRLGQTPAEVKLARARHALSFVLEGHETQERTLDLTHVAREHIEVNVPLPRKRGAP